MMALFTISIFELFVGGGGRLLAVGSVSLRMVLFGACLCASVLAALFPRRRVDGLLVALGFVAAYLAVHVIALAVGIFRGASIGEMSTEMQQSLYWLAAPFFAMVLQSEVAVQRTATLVRIAGAMLAASYLIVILALFLGLISFHTLLETVGQSGEVFFRGEDLFFYKGFLYLGIALLFLVAIRGKLWSLLALVIGAALVMSLTRGLIISTSFAVMLMLFAQRRWRSGCSSLILILAIGFFVWFYLPSFDANLAGRRDISNGQRLDDMAYIADHAENITFIIGHGFGSLINGRLNIENTFLWALWKLGFLGVLFWLAPLVLCTYYYVSIPRRHDNALGNAFYFGTILVYVMTFSNPFLNNPIGLSFVMAAIFSLRTISIETISASSMEQRPMVGGPGNA